MGGVRSSTQTHFGFDNLKKQETAAARGKEVWGGGGDGARSFLVVVVAEKRSGRGIVGVEG